MHASIKKLQGPLEQVCQMKSARGSQQQQQAFQTRSEFEQPKGKSRVVTTRRIRLGAGASNSHNPCTKTATTVQSSSSVSLIEDRLSPSSCNSPAQTSVPSRTECQNYSAIDGMKRTQAHWHSSACSEDNVSFVDIQIESPQQTFHFDSERQMHHIRRLPTIELIDQVDERNNMIEELLRMGEATISGSVDDPSPLSKQSYTESQDGESPKKRSWENWENLDLAADGVLRSLNEQLTAITELVESDGEMPNGGGALKRSASSDSQGTTIWTGATGCDSSEEGDPLHDEMRSLDTLDDEQSSTEQKCIVGHNLKPHRTPSDRWWCSSCLKQMPEGTCLFGCRICNYDECWSCLSARQAQVKQEPCSVATNAPQEILLEGWMQEVALLRQRMQVLEGKLSGVTKERNAMIAENQKLRNHVSRMCRAAMAHSYIP